MTISRQVKKKPTGNHVVVMSRMDYEIIKGVHETILQIPIRDLIPNDLKSGEEVILHASKKISVTKIVYKHHVDFADGTKSAETLWSKKLIKGERKQVNDSLHAKVLELVHEGHFNSARNALELFLNLKNNKALSFTPADLQKSLAVLMNKKRQEAPILACKIENARYVYTKTGSIETIY